MIFEDLTYQYITGTIQSAFARIRLKDYFDLLEELSQNDFYSQLYQQIKEYTKLDEFCRYEFDEAPPSELPYREDVTIGEMMFAACELFKDADKQRRYDENDADVVEYIKICENIARKIVRSIILLPLSDKNIISKLENIIIDRKE